MLLKWNKNWFGPLVIIVICMTENAITPGVTDFTPGMADFSPDVADSSPGVADLCWALRFSHQAQQIFVGLLLLHLWAPIIFSQNGFCAVFHVFAFRATIWLIFWIRCRYEIFRCRYILYFERLVSTPECLVSTPAYQPYCYTETKYMTVTYLYYYSTYMTLYGSMMHLKI